MRWRHCSHRVKNIAAGNNMVRSRQATASTVHATAAASDQFDVSELGRYSPAGIAALALPCATAEIVGRLRGVLKPLSRIYPRRIRPMNSPGAVEWLRSCPRSSASTTTSSSRAHLLADAGCRRSSATAGPHVERRGIGVHEAHRRRHVRAVASTTTGRKADCWVYEDLVYINKRHVAAVGFDRDEMTMSPITYDEMRPGCYEPEGPPRRHGR